MKPVYYSEVLKKYFENEDECVAAEKEYNDKHAAELAKKEERKNDAKKVDEAYKTYLQLRSDFVKKYGSYHCTYTEKDLPDLTDWNWFFDCFKF